MKTLNERIEEAINQLDQNRHKYGVELYRNIRQLIKDMQAELQSQKKMLQRSLNIITQPSSERECELEAENDRLKAELDKREWIKIDEREPEIGKTYLIFSETHGYQTDSYNSNNTGIPDFPRFACPNTTHYMPLPTPPNEDK